MISDRYFFVFLLLFSVNFRLYTLLATELILKFSFKNINNKRLARNPSNNTHTCNHKGAMSDSNYQPMQISGEEGQNEVNPAPTQPVTETSGGLPSQYTQPPAPAEIQQPQSNNEQPAYVYSTEAQQEVPETPQQPILVQNVVQETNVITINTAPPKRVSNQPPLNAPEPLQDLTIISALACLCCGWPCGIFALIFSCNARSAYYRRDWVSYRRQNTNAKGCIAASCVTGIIFVILYFTGVLSLN